MINDQERFDNAIARFDAAHAEDPNTEWVDGQAHPKELVYVERLTAWLAHLAPDAPESVRFATRCQHIRRWTMPRSDYPAGREGYLRWRADLASLHAQNGRCHPA